MRIFILGSTGMLGSRVVERALAAGHALTVLVRRQPDTKPDPRVKIVVGDVRRTELAPLLADQDAVIQTLGVGGKGTGQPTDICAAGTRKLIEAIGDKPTRLIAVSNIGAHGSGTVFFRKFVLPLFVRWLIPIIRDKEIMENELAASPTRWTAVRFPEFVDKPAAKPLRFSYTGNELGFKIALDDAADVLIWLCSEDSYLGEAISVSN
jgi:nucleoside-diphosphate-sugar epimerase